MENLVAVIDLGKSNSKVAIVDTANAEEIEVVRQPATSRTDGLYPCLDHQAIEAFIISALAGFSRRFSLTGITVTTHGATAALVDEAGELVLPVLDYEFDGVDNTWEQYSTVRPDFSETGSPFLPGGLNIGAQLYWQQSVHADSFSNASTIYTWPQYWVNRLCGDRSNDLTSLGCHTDLYQPDAAAYSSLVDKMHWGNLLPPTRQSGRPAGTLSPAFARQIGLQQDVMVYTGIHDSNASLVPHLQAQQGKSFSVVSTGTWFIVMAIAGKTLQLDESRDTLLNINAFGQSVPSARFMGGRERELLEVSDVVSADAMETFLKQDNTPPMLLPSVVRNTGPYPDGKSTWLIEGRLVDTSNDAQLETTDRDCAVTLYLALMAAECMRLIGSDGSTFIEGPLAHDLQFAEMLSVASSRPVYISEAETGTSVGAAMLISAPLQSPRYTSVSLTSVKSDLLERYATRWREQMPSV